MFGLFIWSIATLFFFMNFFFAQVLASFVHEIIALLSISVEQLSLIDVAYCMAYGLMQIPLVIIIVVGFFVHHSLYLHTGAADPVFSRNYFSIGLLVMPIMYLISFFVASKKNLIG